MSATAPLTDANPTVAQMEARVARFAALHAHPGLPRRRHSRLRAHHLSRDGRPPDAPLAAENFHLNIVRCEPGKSAPLHNHLTQEVFVALTGRWEMFWGPAGERSLVLEPWNTMLNPAGRFQRASEMSPPSPGYLMGMASGRDPGNINWPAQVRAAALSVGVELP